jgi:hypothetical protein
MLQIVDDLEDFQILLNSGEIASPRSMERSLAATYAHDVLPDETKDEFIQLTRSDSAQKEMGDKLIGMLDDCGAGLYMLAELEKHFDLGLASLVEAQPAPPTGEKLEAIIRALK